MKCSSVKTLIDGYIDGTCDAKKVRSIEEHISSCEECANELRYAKRVRDKMRELPEMKAPAGFEERIFRMTGTSVPTTGSKILSRLTRKTVLVPLGAAAVIVMGLSVFLITDFRGRFKSADRAEIAKTESADSAITDKKELIRIEKNTAPSPDKVLAKKSTSSEQMRTQRAKEKSPAREYVETEIHLAYNDPAGVVKADLPSPATGESSAEEGTIDSDTLSMKKDSSPSASSRKSAYKSEAPSSATLRDDFAARIDRAIISSGGTRVRLTDRSSSRETASSSGNKVASRDTYTAKVIIPEEEYEGLMKRLSEFGTLTAPKEKPVPENGYMEFTLTVRRGN